MHNVTGAGEDLPGTVIDSDYDDTKVKSQPPMKTVVKSSPDPKSGIEHVLADLGVMMNAKIEAKVESRPTKETSTLQSQIVKAFVCTFKDALQASYSNSSDYLKIAMFNMIERVLGEVIWYGGALTVHEAELPVSDHTKYLADTIVQSVLSNAGFTVQNSEIVGKLVDRAVDEPRLSDIQGASTTTAVTDSCIKLATPRWERPSKIQSSTELHKNIVVVTVVAYPTAVAAKHQYRRDVIRCSRLIWQLIRAQEQLQPPSDRHEPSK